MPDIINNIAKTILWDVFVMGVFFIGTVWLSVVIAIALAHRARLSVTLKGQVAWLRNWCKSPTMIDRGLLGLLALIFVYYVGHLANSISDEWIDLRPDWHLGAKITWCKEFCNDSDTSLKIDVFKKVFPSSPSGKKFVLDNYYDQQGFPIQSDFEATTMEVARILGRPKGRGRRRVEYGIRFSNRPGVRQRRQGHRKEKSTCGN